MSFAEKITIVVASDNHYLIMLAALLKSIEVNQKSEQAIDVWIISDGITAKNRRKLEESLKREIFKLYWISNKNVVPKGMRLPLDRNTYPLSIFMRLFIPYFLPVNIKKALYMDVDMIANTDISPLWNTDITNHVVAAVTDNGGNSSIRNSVPNYKDLNLPGDAKFFNSGLLLINTEKWRDNNITVKVINSVNLNRKHTKYSDQYGLNVNLVGQWLELDPLWNCFSNSDHPNPHITHFAYRKPFYKSYFYNVSHQKNFYRYLNLTKWAGSNPVGETKRKLIKLRNVAEKIPLYLAELFKRR